MSTRRRWKRALATLVGVCGAVLLLIGVQPAAAFAVLERLAPNVVWRVRTDQPLVALTFDDGPHPVHTPQVLDILDRAGARATFFLIGERAEAHPEIVLRIKAAGHEVGNHYLTKTHTYRHSDDDFLARLARTERAAGIVGPRKLFRPPGGVTHARHLRLARERGYTCVLGSAYLYDGARQPPAGYIEWLVEKNLAPGAIVILHDGIEDPARSLSALPRILAEGNARGLRFVSAGTLLDAAR